MKISTLLLAVIIAASMTSCNDVPEDVKSRTAEQNNEGVTQIVTDSAGNEKPAEKIGNITFDCEPDPIETEEFYILRSPTTVKFDPEKDYGPEREKFAQAAKELIGLDVDKAKIDIFTYKGDDLYNSKKEIIEYIPPMFELYDTEYAHAEMYGTSDMFVFTNQKYLRTDKGN